MWWNRARKYMVIHESGQHIQCEKDTGVIWWKGTPYQPIAGKVLRTEIPLYASLDFDVNKWWQVLDESDIDDTARRNLFLLAQMGNEGQMEALDLVCKLQHKQFKHELKNPSRWLHSASSTARTRLRA